MYNRKKIGRFIMNAKKEMRNHVIKIGILIVAIITIGISVSYAYYTAVANEEVKVDKVQAGRLDITSTLETSGAINNAKMSLINASDVKNDADKVEFTVTNANTSTVSGRYFIYLTNIEITKNLYNEDFKWELVRVTSSGESTIANGSFATAVRSSKPDAGESDKVLTTAENISLNKVALEIPKATTDNLIFRLWLENDPVNNQLNLTEGSFKGRLRIEATAVK